MRQRFLLVRIIANVVISLALRRCLADQALFLFDHLFIVLQQLLGFVSGHLLVVAGWLGSRLLLALHSTIVHEDLAWNQSQVDLL